MFVGEHRGSGRELPGPRAPASQEITTDQGIDFQSHGARFAGGHKGLGSQMAGTATKNKPPAAPQLPKQTRS